MRVVFLDNVDGVALAGDIKTVADGYARNFLIPRKLATAATPAEVQRAEAVARKIQAEQAKKDMAAQTVADRINEKVISITARVGEQGRLYGSVTSNDIAEQLTKLAGTEIEHRQVQLAAPIKDLGSHELTVTFTRNVKAQVTVEVLAEGAKEVEGGKEIEAVPAADVAPEGGKEEE